MSQKPKDDTARLLEKHFGKGKDNQTTVPGVATPPKRERLGLPGLERRAAAPQVSQAALTTPSAAAAIPAPSAPATSTAETHQLQLEKVMSTIANDIENMRAAMELMVDQIGKMVSLQNEQTSLHKEELAGQRQQIEAVARLAPIIARSAEGMSITMRDALSEIRESTAPLAKLSSGEPARAPVAISDASQVGPVSVNPSSDVSAAGVPAHQASEPAASERARQEEEAGPAMPAAAATAGETSKTRKEVEIISEDERNRRFLRLASQFMHPATFGAKEALETVPEFGYLQKAYGNLKTAVKRGFAQSLKGGLFRFTKSAADDLREALEGSTALAPAEVEAPGVAAAMAAPVVEAKASKAAKVDKSDKAPVKATLAAQEAEPDQPEKKARKQPDRVSEVDRHRRWRNLAVKFPHPMPFGAKEALEAIPDLGYLQNAYGSLKTAAKRGFADVLGGGLFRFTATAASELKAAIGSASSQAGAAAMSPVEETSQAESMEPKARKGSASGAPAARAGEAAVVEVKRPRGRPRKHPRPDDVVTQAAQIAPSEAAPKKGAVRKDASRQPELSLEDAPVVAKSGRGRPPKVSGPGDVVQAAAVAPAQPVEVEPKKARAPKVAAAQPELSLNAGPAVVKRPRGRPRKNPEAAEAGLMAGSVSEGAVVGREATKSAAILDRVNWGEKEWSRHVSVYSQPDRKSPKKFATVIQLDRKFWDQAGFSPDDRLQIERHDDVVVITRAESGGVKPKKVGDTTVVIQANTLGNLNLRQVKAATDEDTMVLRGSQI